MNSKNQNIDEILNYAKKSLKSENEDDIIEFEKIKFQLDFLNKVQDLMNKSDKKMSRQNLADNLGVSKSMVSQLFSGDKQLNLDLIVKIQKIFNKKIRLTFEEKSIIKDIKVKTSENRLTTHREALRMGAAFKEVFYVEVKPNVGIKDKGWTVGKCYSDLNPKRNTLGILDYEGIGSHLHGIFQPKLGHRVEGIKVVTIKNNETFGIQIKTTKANKEKEDKIFIENFLTHKENIEEVNSDAN